MVTNDEGLSTTLSVPLTVRRPDDWCAGRSRDVRDAPSYTTGWSSSDENHYEIIGTGHCEGELGFTLSKTSSTTTLDTTDVYRFWGCFHILSGCYSEPKVGTPLMIRVSTGTVGVRVRVEYIGGIRSTITVQPNSSGTISVQVGHYVLHHLIIDNPVGKGSYTVDISPAN